jgi:hypothetical protein
MNALPGQFDELLVGGVQALKSQPLLEQVVPRTFDLALECWLVIHCDSRRAHGRRDKRPVQYLRRHLTDEPVDKSRGDVKASRTDPKAREFDFGPLN